MAQAAPAPDGRFREEVVATLRALHPDWVVELNPRDPEVFHLGSLEIYVGNLARAVEGMNPAARKAEIASFLDMIAARKRGAGKPQSAPETFDAAKPKLRIQVVPVAYFKQAKDLLRRSLSDELAVGYALDSENAYQLVTEPMRAQWAVDLATLESAAIANLEAQSRAVPAAMIGEKGNGFVIVSTGDSYDAARLVVPSFMKGLRENLGPRVTAIAPRRDLLCAWTTDFGGRAMLYQEMRKDFEKGPYSRSVELFASSADGLRPLTASEMTAYRG